MWEFAHRPARRCFREHAHTSLFASASMCVWPGSECARRSVRLFADACLHSCRSLGKPGYTRPLIDSRLNRSVNHGVTLGERASQ